MSDDCEFSTGALTKERIAQFSVAMQDPNPVHLDPSFCASIGLPGIIAPGGIGVVAIAHAIGLRYEARTIRELDISFRSPVHVGESLRCRFEVIDEKGPTMTLTAHTTGDDVRTCADGTVTVEGEMEEQHEDLRGAGACVPCQGRGARVRNHRRCDVAVVRGHGRLGRDEWQSRSERPAVSRPTPSGR